MTEKINTNLYKKLVSLSYDNEIMNNEFIVNLNLNLKRLMWMVRMK